jgi:hypothetical protein
MISSKACLSITVEWNELCEYRIRKLILSQYCLAMTWRKCKWAGAEVKWRKHEFLAVDFILTPNRENISVRMMLRFGL